MIELERIADESKNTVVIFNVAHMLTIGYLGFRTDMVKDISLFIRAMELGDARAARRLVDVFHEDESLEGDDILTAAEVNCRAIVDTKNTSSMHSLANIIWKRKKLKTDMNLVINLFETAMQGGNLKSTQNLTAIYSYGRDGVPQDKERAVNICRETLKTQKCYDIEMVLGSILIDQEDNGDVKDGIILLEKACTERDDAPAMNALAALYGSSH